MLTPEKRRSLSYLSAGALGYAALRELIHGSLNSAHILAFAATGSILIPTLKRNSQWFGPIVTKFATHERKVWITIDDGPDPEETPGILQVLYKHQVKATFFAIGARIKRWPELAREIVKAGHGLQNHTYHHSVGSFWCASPSVAAREIRRGSDIIFEITGTQPNLFRTPVGLANPFVHAAAQRAGLKMIGWTATGWDGITHYPDKVVSRIMANLSPGAIILIHDGAVKGMELGARARTLENLLVSLKAKGYETILPEY